MPEPTMAEMTCPFQPCTARFTTIPLRPRSDEPERVIAAVPLHAVEGPGRWFQRYCPASSMAVLPLSGADRQQLDDAYHRYERMRAERERGDSWAPGAVWTAPPSIRRESEMHGGAPEASEEECWRCADEGVTPVPAFPHRLDVLIHIMREHGSDVRADVSPPPGGDIQSYFPTRPAESEELEQHQQGTGGGQNMSDSRGSLKGVLSLATASASEAQATCSGITNALDTVAGLFEKLVQEHQTAAAMAVAAVGGDGGDLPQSARDMMQAASRLGEIVSDMRGVIETLRARNDGAYRAAGIVADRSREYAGQI